MSPMGVSFIIFKRQSMVLFCALINYIGQTDYFVDKPGSHNPLSEDALMLNAIIETATDGIITIGEDGIIQMVNSAATQLFGYEINELRGNSVKMLMPSPYSEKHDGYIHRYLQGGPAKIIGIGREVIGKKKDGTLFPIRLSISEVNLEDRRIFTGIVHDLSRQKKAEKDLREERKGHSVTSILPIPLLSSSIRRGRSSCSMKGGASCSG